MSAKAPELEEPARERHRELPLAGSLEMIERSAQVVVIGLEPIEPRSRISTEEARLGLVGEAQEVLRMSPAEATGLVRVVETLSRVLADRLEHREARLVVANEALIDERLERIDVRFGHRFGRLERASTVEDSESREEPTLLRREKADVHRLLERMARFTRELSGLDIPLVTTHGDSGGGNFLVDDAGRVHLVDWDSLGLGPPERDLSKLPGRRFDEVLTAYLDAGGPRSLHPELFAFYGYWWAPEMIGACTTSILFESPTPQESADWFHDLQEYLPMRWDDFEASNARRAAILAAHGIHQPG